MLTQRERFANALKEQHRLLFDYDRKCLKEQYAQYISCPVCDSSESVLLFEKDWFRFVKCKNCSMVYLNPRLNDEATYAFYNSDVNSIYNESKFDTVSNSTILDDKINFSNLVLIENRRHANVKGNLLEIGSAKGYFLMRARELGYSVYGIELNKKNFLLSRNTLGGNIKNVDLFEARFSDNMFDVIYMRDVIEHIPDPKPFLRELHRIARKGCLLFLETHNIEGLIHQIVRERHTVIFGFEHPNHWSPDTLERVLRLTGFDVRDVVHKSLDFTVRSIIGYFLASSFTTVYPRQSSDGRRLFLRILRKPFTLWPVSYLDSKVTPQIANWLKCGSVIKVMAKKKGQ